MEEITTLLERVRAGDSAAEDALARAVYDHLRSLARQQRRRWRGEAPLDTTALVHETWLKVARGGYENRGHFFAVATRAIRQLLVNQAERHRAQRRGGGAPHVPLDEANALVTTDDDAHTILSVASAVDKLRDRDAELATLVEYRFFAGFTVEEIAELTAQSPRTIKRRWQRARAWLAVTLDDPAEFAT
ncbi:MAG: ECF-type sigma factor [Deltaproteobacteria bacterium]